MSQERQGGCVDHRWGIRSRVTGCVYAWVRRSRTRSCCGRPAAFRNGMRWCSGVTTPGSLPRRSACPPSRRSRSARWLCRHRLTPVRAHGTSASLSAPRLCQSPTLRSCACGPGNGDQSGPSLVCEGGASGFGEGVIRSHPKTPALGRAPRAGPWRCGESHGSHPGSTTSPILQGGASRPAGEP